MATKVEIWKAIDTGSEAEEYLERALEKLNKAKGWGIADILGGKAVVTAIKRGYMNDAQELIDQGYQYLQEFSIMLNGTGLDYRIDGDDGMTLHVMDYAMDNMITDIMTQSRINDTINEVRQTIKEVDDTIHSLQDELWRMK